MSLLLSCCVMACNFAKYPIYPDKPGHDLIEWPFRVKYEKSAFINSQHPLILPRVSGQAPPTQCNIWYLLSDFVLSASVSMSPVKMRVRLCVCFFSVLTLLTEPKRRELVTLGSEVIHDLLVSTSKERRVCLKDAHSC